MQADPWWSNHLSWLDPFTGGQAFNIQTFWWTLHIQAIIPSLLCLFNPCSSFGYHPSWYFQVEALINFSDLVTPSLCNNLIVVQELAVQWAYCVQSPILSNSHTLLHLILIWTTWGWPHYPVLRMKNLLYMLQHQVLLLYNSSDSWNFMFIQTKLCALFPIKCESHISRDGSNFVYHNIFGAQCRTWHSTMIWMFSPNLILKFNCHWNNTEMSDL